ENETSSSTIRMRVMQGSLLVRRRPVSAVVVVLRDRPVGRRGQGHREGRAASLLAPDAHPSPVVLADVLDDGQAEPGAPGGARAGGVDPVEALEDALLLGRRDALALVGDG